MRKNANIYSENLFVFSIDKHMFAYYIYLIQTNVRFQIKQEEFIMKRVYNEKISPRANESLTRREHTVQTQKRVIVLVCIITFAGSRAEQPIHKYYTSVQLQKGDSLWSLADQYAASDRTSRAQFIDEVCELNGISEDNTLHSGEYLVVSYYSPEIR